MSDAAEWANDHRWLGMWLVGSALAFSTITVERAL